MTRLIMMLGIQTKLNDIVKLDTTEAKLPWLYCVACSSSLCRTFVAIPCQDSFL